MARRFPAVYYMDYISFYISPSTGFVVRERRGYTDTYEVPLKDTRYEDIDLDLDNR